MNEHKNSKNSINLRGKIISIDERKNTYIIRIDEYIENVINFNNKTINKVAKKIEVLELEGKFSSNKKYTIKSPIELYHGYVLAKIHYDNKPMLFDIVCVNVKPIIYAFISGDYPITGYKLI